jgi:hypothetical protein
MGEQFDDLFLSEDELKIQEQQQIQSDEDEDDEQEDQGQGGAKPSPYAPPVSKDVSMPMGGIQMK